MQQSFVDVQAGTRITGVYLPGRVRDSLSGSSCSTKLMIRNLPGVFDIWLDPRTRNPELREQLLGVSR